VSKREQAARARAARERVARIEQALAYLPQVQAAKERQQQTLATPKRATVSVPRTSTTDPEARVMKMPDGGFRPAYNVELATDATKGIIVGVAVTAEGTDAGQAVPMQAVPMEEQVVQRTGQPPQDYLVDGGFATREDITTLAQRGITVYAPVRLPRNKPEDERYQPRAGDSPAVVAWRARMKMPDGGFRPAYNDGHAGGQDHLPTAGQHRGMGERAGPPARRVPVHRARPRQRDDGAALGCGRSQPPALGRADERDALSQRQ
jgi:hypothetical protein